jgi:DNA transformation protein
MAVSDEFADYIRDQFSALSVVTIRRMFGGAGIYFGDAIFALADNNTLYLKVGAKTRPRFEAAGCKPFEPWPGHVMAGYWTVPIDVLEDREALASWARDAVAESKSRSRRKPAKGRRRK